jgi:hypothetical protein
MCEYGVPYSTLCDCVKHGTQPWIARKLVNKALIGYQEEALIDWLIYMCDSYMLVTPKILEDFAN